MKPRRRPYLTDLFFSNSAQHKDQLMRPNLEMQVDCFLPFFCCSTWLWCWEYLPCWPGSEAWLTTSSWPISLVSTPACFAVCCFCVLFYCFVSIKTELQQPPLLWQLYRSSCFRLVTWQSGRTSVSDWRTFPVLCSTCSWWVTTIVGKLFATCQPTRPTQPFILSGSINE